MELVALLNQFWAFSDYLTEWYMNLLWIVKMNDLVTDLI